MKCLQLIQSPDDLKNINISLLPTLAEEIRNVIVETVSKTGGHLASSLGVVELTIALHYVFDTPKDTIIWDVGHQSYAHKILTGRKDQFHTLRQFNGMSGFIRRNDSEYDTFSTGHSSTSISAGLGVTCARHLMDRQSKVIAVIGDGSMTAGLAYEALNQAGDLHKDLIVILNDNDMSISPNVGAISSFLSRNLSHKFPQNIKHGIGDLIKRIPGIGRPFYQFAKRSEDMMKTFITPGMLFEAFNFDYFGPINGHHLKHLIRILKNIRELHEPVLLHVITTKGKGYPPAEKNPIYFHGVGAFDVQNGCCEKSQSKAPTYTEVFGNTLVELATNDNRIVAVTAAMPEGTGLVRFSQQFPDRFFDVGIAEQHGVTFAAGMAAEGLKPVVAIYSTFLQRSYDQIIHDVCLDALPVVFAIDRGGIVGQDGPTHQGLFDLSYLRHLPNMVVMAPKDENELRHMLFTAFKHDGPIALRYPRGRGIGVSTQDTLVKLPLGVPQVIANGHDLMILAIGHTVNTAITARKKLLDHKIEATLVNCRFVKPLDADHLMPLVEKHSKIITIEENALQGGFGSAILELLSDHDASSIKVRRIGLPDQFIPHGSQEQVRNKFGITASHIVACALQMI
ncbi:MAG: 1-deoxy-D-xylulose-5-phosphate synthase [Candidatus Magnetoglobus multicellularis str. Araruama]|uniref:1-deoxy-D-xylulose-5-phosphate synthase n=1 Tax=Candidatus Magnetoglobus multicellularis str. Araruama TaxID=890399 RepID=A0A1V1PHP0_9BACT|nr:MAG: 1-deoxy-D-xylulose-5-phosphate synthase [Candidatus Magnetoglobus multicellularis str. Araruama]